MLHFQKRGWLFHKKTRPGILQSSQVEYFVIIVRGDTHMTSIFRLGGAGGNNEMLSDVGGGGGGGVVGVLDVQSFFFLIIKENWIFAMIWSFKLGRPSQGGGKFLDVDGQGRGGSWKLDIFHGRHVCCPLVGFSP